MTNRTPHPLFRRTHGTLALAVVAATAWLAGCAAPGGASDRGSPAAVARSAAAPLIQVPPSSVGTWVDLGHVLAPWLAGDAPVPVSGPAAPTRIAGLQREDGRWLAIVIAQVAPSGGAPCPLPTSLHVVDSGTTADGCLRMRRDADFDRWLPQQHSVLYQWLEGRHWASRPRAWVGFRVPADSGRAIEAHALIDPALIEPVSRSNADFLAGGQPGVQWARAFAAATRAASAGGALNVPPFPFAPKVAPPAQPAVVAPPPARATQVPPPRPPVQAPRRDRE
ncbi:hypothetical protein [Ottowia testudinis]|uniref:Uncharacterized protein n=1 Tax=Ottowia testudinis TaxID=2816950 RepID=A0A975CHA7_9BURK|nr:hypothetical protein [Ottowia testudinis]QTD45801.1 hypothetical protein J1M35_02445 [Ottowia testudinis]